MKEAAIALQQPVEDGPWVNKVEQLKDAWFVHAFDDNATGDWREVISPARAFTHTVGTSWKITVPSGGVPDPDPGNRLVLKVTTQSEHYPKPVSTAAPGQSSASATTFHAPGFYEIQAVSTQPPSSQTAYLEVIGPSTGATFTEVFHIDPKHVLLWPHRGNATRATTTWTVTGLVSPPSLAQHTKKVSFTLDRV